MHKGRPNQHTQTQCIGCPTQEVAGAVILFPEKYVLKTSAISKVSLPYGLLFCLKCFSCTKIQPRDTRCNTELRTMTQSHAVEEKRCEVNVKIILECTMTTEREERERERERSEEHRKPLVRGRPEPVLSNTLTIC